VNNLWILLLKKHRPVFVCMIIMSLLDGMCQLLIVGITYKVIEIPSNANSFRLFFIFILAVLIYSVSQKINNELVIDFIEKRIAEIRLNVIDNVRSTYLRTYESIGTDKIYTSLTFDIKAVSDISSTISLTIRVFLGYGFLLFYMAYLSLTAFVIFISIQVLLLLFTLYSQIRLRAVIKEIRETEKNLFESFRHLFDGFKETRLDHKKNDDFYNNSLKYHTENVRREKIKEIKYITGAYTASYGIWIYLMVLLIFLIPFATESKIEVLFEYICIIMYMSISFIVQEIMRFTVASISVQRFYELEQELTILDQEISTTAEEKDNFKFHNISYVDIKFHYESQSRYAFSVGPLSLTINAGEIVFIVGGNGSGKSTLVKLITGLYNIDSGKVFLDGKEIQISQYRWMFSPIFPDFHLFDRLYGLSGIIDEKEVNNMIRLMKLEKAVQFSSGKFTSLDLSTGQKKRLAMVAAMMENKPIFIFDEWAADQDPHFRDYFYNTLLPMFKVKGKTVIAITHDDRYFHVADKVVKLEYGKLY